MIKDMFINEDGFPVYPWIVGPVIDRFLPAIATASDIFAIAIGNTFRGAK